MASFQLPALDYDIWKDTYETLHLWSQIVGKIRLAHEPWANHSWYSTLYVTSSGLGTPAVPHNLHNFSIEINFKAHTLDIKTSNAGATSLALTNESIASFYGRVMHSLRQFGIESRFVRHPNEMLSITPFDLDRTVRLYNSTQARAFYDTLVPVNNWLKEFRSRFIGKCSPVHFFWGSFDLAVTRFSGRRAPAHPGGIPNLPDRITREAYSHEVSSCGFWPGNSIYPHAAFYSYAYPEPTAYSKATVTPTEAFYHPALHEFLLPYEVVYKSESPSEMVKSFLQSTYESAANLGGWDRDLLEESPYRDACAQLLL